MSPARNALMPTIINGIGTWYCGKRRIHRVKTACPHCGAFAELESYDTTLCFVVFMIPIVPLSERRILQNCPVCQRHRVVKLRDWEAGKSQAFNAILEKLQANPDDRETIQNALGLATVYQDERLFDKLADALVGHRTDDAEIQAQLGSAYEYFSRWPDAEAAYRRSLGVESSDDTRERLAVCLLKQGRPDEATDYVKHAFESKDKDKAWLIFWLVEGFMERGMHEEALRVMDVRDDLYPSLARTKDYQKQRRTAEKNLKSGKPVKSAYLAESTKTGFREGSKLGFKWPKYVAAAVILGLLALYLGAAFYRGQNRPVYLVNGWTRPYTVKVNGQEHQLPPGAYKKVEISEGDVTVDWPEGGDGPQTVKVETGFFGRPFDRPVFVINPDRLALVERDEAIYANPPVNEDTPHEVRTGQLLYRFPEVNYEFEPFPREIPIKGGAHVRKTRVGVIPVPNTQVRLFLVMARLPQDMWSVYAKRVVHLDPNDSTALMLVTNTLPPAEAVAFLRDGLAVRPIRVEWHREYERLTDVTEPTKDLRPEYRALVEETKRAPDAVYLLARLESGPEADKLYAEAANGNPPSAQANSELGFRHLSRGEFAEAVARSTKARELNPSDLLYQKRHLLALMAAEKWADLLKATTPQRSADTTLFLRERLAAFVATGEHGAADGEIGRDLAPIGPGRMNLVDAQERAQRRLERELVLAAVKRDRAKYLELAGKVTEKDPFAERVLRGNYKAAGKAETPAVVNTARDWEQEATRAGLLYLAGLKAKDAPFAEEQWKRFTAALGRGDREARLCAALSEGKQPFDVARAKSATIAPTIKRVVLAALARKYPEHAKELDALSKKLDFERDDVSLCLRYVTE